MLSQPPLQRTEHPEKHPAGFFTLAFGTKPYSHQTEFISDKHQSIIFKCGRQVGKTTVCAAKAIFHAATHSNQTILIVSPTQRQSGIMFRTIRDAILRNHGIQKHVMAESATSIRFDNGSTLYSLPAGYDAHTIRGYAANLIIVDEAAYLPEACFTAIEPSLAATNGQLVLVGTPFGQRGKFYAAWNSPAWSRHEAISLDNPTITKDWLEKQRQNLTENEYRQEYLGEFVAAVDTFFPRDLILQCAQDGLQPNDRRERYLGVDLARAGSDESVYTIAEVDEELNVGIVHIETTSKKPLTDAMGRIQVLDREWGFRKIYVDSSGMGAGVTDVVQESFELRTLDVEIRGKLKPVTFTLENKELMYRNLKVLMESGKIKFPSKERLIQQLSELQYDYSNNGHLRVHHPDDPHAHDDYPDSLALSVFALARPKPPKFYAAASNRRW